MALLEHVKEFIKALEDGKTGEDLATFYAPGVEQVEYPNYLVKNGATRDLAALLDGAEKGKKLLISQRFDIQNFYENGNTVILESIWTGRVSIPVGRVPAGGEMKAYFAQFYEFENGKIIRQRNYDCFEPF